MKETTRPNKALIYILKAILFCAVFTGIFVAFSFVKNLIPDNFERVSHGIIGTLAAFLTTVLFLKVDKKTFSDIGLGFERTTIMKFLAGVVIGVMTMGILATSVMCFANIVIEANPASGFLYFLLATLPLIPLAFMEELGFRAYPLELLKGKLGIRLSIAITSILFGVYHIANGWTVASSFLGPAVWGLVFGLAAIYSKGIAMPTGIHYAANLTNSAFGAAGNTVSIWIIKPSNTAIANNHGVDLTAILPALALLVFAIICIELYLRRKTTANTGIANIEAEH